MCCTALRLVMVVVPSAACVSIVGLRKNGMSGRQQQSRGVW